MIESQLDKFFRIARERYEMKLRREQGKPAPWTEDKVLSAWRFCHVFREDDKTTKWFRQNVRGFLQHQIADVIFATVAFRWFNRIETGEKIQDLLTLRTWSSDEARRRLKGISPVVTGAYIIKTPDGKTKLDGVLWCIDQVFTGCGDMAAAHVPGEITLQAFHEVLCEYPFMGPFMAYQVVSDLLHTDVLRDAPDRRSWACPGPGCARGLGWLVSGEPDLYSRGNKKDVKEMLTHLQLLQRGALQEEYWPQHWPRWEMQTCQHWCCEFDKYCRAEGGQRMKRKYP